MEDIQDFFNSNSQDFIVYKASLLLNDSDNDPVKKASVIRDIVESISKVSDFIKRELYIKECSKIMNISEQVIYSTLAQISKQNLRNLSKKKPVLNEPISLIKSEKKKRSVNELYELEKKIIEILLLYGNEVIEFEEEVFKKNEKGELITENTKRTLKVFEKIYMDLHIDEIEFTNEDFRNIYYGIIESFNENKKINIEDFINRLSDQQQHEVTNIIMDNEKHVLHNWEKNNIYPKSKINAISQLTIETILNLRCNLIDKKVSEFKNENLDQSNVLEQVVNYMKLKRLLSEKLNRVL